ncbi:MAG: hypothetical protein HQL38_00450 [Alphaproteobacteria bacterium]|nr:hypothetical protein [Alphaproteobacteria bacterium]MBF0391123.1 hypothetical protein [Alphaproteobacteria bacterium]
MADTARRLFAGIFRIGAGPILWAANLALVYGVTAVACARGANWVVKPAILAATLIAASATVWVLAREIGRRRSAPPERQVAFFAAAMAGLSLVAILWLGLPVAFVPACP